MEYPDVVDSKKRIITSFMKYYNQYWVDKQTIPYSQSLYSLADTLRGLDYAYENGYREACGSKPSKKRHYPSMIELVEALHSQNVSVGEICSILGYEEAEVKLMVELLEL